MFKFSKNNGKCTRFGEFKSKCRLSTYTALVLFSLNANAVTGVGEYRFGPDTTENMACEIAEDRAQQDALIRFNGQFIEAVIEENCRSEDCRFNQQTFNKIEGYIKKMTAKRQVVTEQGYKVCVVTVNAEVEKLKNDIKFSVDGSFEYKDGDEIQFRGVSNNGGYVYLYNYYNGKYVKILRKVATQNEEFVLPSESYRMKAELPKGTLQSKELLMFLFVNQDVSMKDSYTDIEMKSAINQIPASNRRVITRYINILRK
jgi:hypothetical protein